MSTLAKLIQDATNAKMIVRQDADNTVLIRRSKLGAGVWIVRTESGAFDSAVRADVGFPLEAGTTIRTVRDCRKVLGL